MNYFIDKCKPLLCFSLFITITLALCSCNISIPDYLIASATVEAGNTFSANDFLLEEGHVAEFATDFAAEYVQDGLAKLNKIGTHSVGLIVDGKNYTINLTVQDTIAPKAVARTPVVRQGDTLPAEECVTDITDSTNVSCSFRSEPDLTHTGVLSEIVILSDEAGNQTEIPVTITVLEANQFLPDKCTIEAGDSIPDIEELVVFNRTGTYVTDISVINTDLVGSYTLEADINGTIYTTELIIEDTVAPTATVTPLSVYYGSPFPSADRFVSEIIDKGPVTVSYETDPGETVTDQNEVHLVLTDQGGNKTSYTTQCIIVEDTEAPAFLSFPEQLEANVGEMINWRSAVTAEDNSGMVELSLDTSGADLEKAGTYTVCFVAADPAGNETRQEVQFILHDISVTEEMMDELCEEILSKIITEGMTAREELYAVWKYVGNRISYVNEGAHDDIRREAYLGLTTRRNGDCFAFYAASYELLTHLGYEVQTVRRRSDLTSECGNHFWLLVNCGTQEEPLWYHHDSSVHAKPYNYDTSMMTDAQLRAYTNYRAATSSMKHYYTFDTSLHPASAAEIVVEWDIDAKYYD